MRDNAHMTADFKFPDLPRTAGAMHSAHRTAKTMTKAELAEALFDRLGLNKREAKDMVDGFFDEIRQALERGESVKLSGFGISSCVTSRSVRDETRKQVKRSR